MKPSSCFKMLLKNSLALLAALAMWLSSGWVHSRPLASDSFEEPTMDPIHTVHYHFDKQMDPVMQLHKLEPTTDSNNITCNDGSLPGYYKRLNNHSRSWIIYLQGGGYCGSEEACRHRWQRSRHLMSSHHWPRTRSVDGILSSEPKDNPYLWNANHIYVPYCSSDSWSGSAPIGPDRSFAFMGSQIVERVLESLFEDLPREWSLYEAKFILLAGDSAGATGVILNLDRVNKFVQRRFSTLRSNCSLDSSNSCEPRQAPVLRGLADSGWFLDNEPYDFEAGGGEQQLRSMLLAEDGPDCDRTRCTPLQSIRQAMLLWNGQVPPSCRSRHRSEPWRCYFGYRVYKTLKTPLFVVQWLYDEAQLMVDNIGRPESSSQWSYVGRVANEFRRSLENVTALFAPSCFSHSLIVKQSWNQININGLKLPYVLNSWGEETLSSQPSLEALLASDQLDSHQQPARSLSLHSESEQSGRQLIQLELRPALTAKQSLSQPAAGRPKGGRKRKQRNNASSQNRPSSNANRLSRSTLVDDSTILFNNNVPDVLIMPSTLLAASQQPDLDKFRLMDLCGWPQCNKDCPGLDMDQFNLRLSLPF